MEFDCFNFAYLKRGGVIRSCIANQRELVLEEGEAVDRDIIAVSGCICVEKLIDRYKYIFHFKGAFAGHPIKEVQTYSLRCLGIVVGKEYILHLKPLRVESRVLWVEVSRYSLLEDHLISLS